tara:strand:- start:1640 stop:2791 length:1152 start_codon:yes stop_codon:yes gene_type:complete
MLFNEIAGNTEVKKQLINSVNNNRVSHAQLFLGNTGCAKLALALAYAQFLNCKERLHEDSCGKCSSCLKHSNLTHPDLHLIFPVLKTKNIKKPISDNFVDQWRKIVNVNPYLSLNNWINSFGTENKTGQQGTIYKDEVINIYKKIRLKNYEGKYRIILIWMPEQMNIGASNKLLKTLEEPPKGTLFLVISEDSGKLISTIKSRLQTIKVNNFSVKDIVDYFGEDKLDHSTANNLKNLTNSNLGEIKQIITNKTSVVDFFETFSTWARLSYKTDILAISRWVDVISLAGKQQQVLFLSYAIKTIRQCLIYNFASKQLLSVSQEELLFISKFSSFIHEGNSILIVEKLEKTIKSIQRNANAKILFFELSLQMVKFLKYKRKFALN